ncbi:glycoside hydrolase family 16 protein [Flavilitoribacter nigricans]|nr:glycoside hydrolase family 16 protein [Flavilitoribacter nigricans]
MTPLYKKGNNRWLRKMSWLFVLFFAFSACDNDDDLLTDRNWQLTWSDDFDGPAGQLPDASNWVLETGRGPNGDGWGNAELQYYTDRPENVSLDGNGNLAITARRESYAGAPYTSARLKTQGRFEQAYGRFEARIKMPWGPGIWPAFWMLGASIETEPWPQCGEIDIMEYRGQEPNIIHGSVHGPGYSGGSPITKSYALPDGRFDTDFHVFALEWGEGFLNFYVDDVVYQQIREEEVGNIIYRESSTGDSRAEWVFDQPFFMLLNVAVGGNYVGFPAQETTFPQTMLVDYVRVYREAN